MRIGRTKKGKREECMCGGRIEKELRVEERGLCECMVGQARQKRERGSMCVCVGK